MPPLPRITVVTLVLAGVSCAPSYVVVPASGGDMASTKGAGLVLNAVPNAWNDDPVELNRYLTPIWIQVINRGKSDVRVVYSDFALTSSRGLRYAAISPYQQRTNTPLSSPPSAAPSTTDTARETSEWYFDKGAPEQERAQFVPLGDGTSSVELVRAGGRPGGGHSAGGHFGGHFGRNPGGLGLGRPEYAGGFYGPPGAYGHYGFYGYYSPWPHFYAWPPYYGPYVYHWGPSYYPERPSESVMRRGLPEGVLHAGGSVSGFVYFQHAAAGATGLDLSFTPHRADGKRLTTLHLSLAVVEE